MVISFPLPSISKCRSRYEADFYQRCFFCFGPDQLNSEPHKSEGIGQQVEQHTLFALECRPFVEKRSITLNKYVTRCLYDYSLVCFPKFKWFKFIDIVDFNITFCITMILCYFDHILNLCKIVEEIQGAEIPTAEW